MRVITAILLASNFFALAQTAAAQTINLPSQPKTLPYAPQPRVAQSSFFVSPLLVSAPQISNSQQSSSSPSQAASSTPTSNAPMRLTRRDAEQLAIKNNPRISVGRLLALAQHQVSRESRSALLP